MSVWRSASENAGLIRRDPTSGSATTAAANAVVDHTNNTKRPTPIVIYPTALASVRCQSGGVHQIRREPPSGAATTVAANAASAVVNHTNNTKRPTPIVIYPTVSPESIVVPIISCIFGLPLLALTLICCLRKRAKLARERDRRRNCELDRASAVGGELSVVRVSPVRCRGRAVSLVRSPRALPALELDTVLEERSDPEQTTFSQVETTPDNEVGAIFTAAAGSSSGAGASGSGVCDS